MPAWRQMFLTGTPASACLRIETIWVSVNFDFFMEPPGWENMPESSTFVVSADQGSLRCQHTAGAPDQADRTHAAQAQAATAGPDRHVPGCSRTQSLINQ